MQVNWHIQFQGTSALLTENCEANVLAKRDYKCMVLFAFVALHTLSIQAAFMVGNDGFDTANCVLLTRSVQVNQPAAIIIDHRHGPIESILIGDRIIEHKLVPITKTKLAVLFANDKPGIWMPLIKFENGVILQDGFCEWRADSESNFLKYAILVLSGIALFVAQEKLRETFKEKARLEQAKLKMIQICDDCIECCLADDRGITTPEWITHGSLNEWQLALQARHQYRFSPIIVSLIRDWNENLITRDAFLEKFRCIRDTLTR